MIKMNIPENEFIENLLNKVLTLHESKVSFSGTVP
jgi:hypothetical protein